MELNEYQKKAAETDHFTEVHDLMAPGMLEKVLGLAGEAGEVADDVKKVIRDEEGQLTDENREIIAKELGDVLWYIAGISRYLGYSLEEIAEMNIEKLQSRKERGVLAGSGDNR